MPRHEIREESGLECRVPCVANHLGTDLDEFLFERRERPLADSIGERQSPEEVREVAGKNEQLEPDLVVFNIVAGETRPIQGVPPLFDPLLRVPLTLRRKVQLLSVGTISR